MGLTEPGCPRLARALRTPCPDRALRGRGTLRGVESVSSVPSCPHQLLPPLEFCSALSVPGSLSPAQALSLLHPRRESACRPWPVTDRGQPPLPKAGPGRPGGDRAAVPPAFHVGGPRCPRYRRQLALAVEREQSLEREKVQLGLDWQRRCDHVERDRYQQSEELVRGLATAKEQVSAPLASRRGPGIAPAAPTPTPRCETSPEPSPALCPGGCQAPGDGAEAA